MATPPYTFSRAAAPPVMQALPSPTRAATADRA